MSVRYSARRVLVGLLATICVVWCLFAAHWQFAGATNQSESTQGEFDFVATNNVGILLSYTGQSGTVRIPKSINQVPITCLGGECFSCYLVTNMTRLMLPATITNISIDSLVYNMNLTDINVEASNQAYCSIDGVLYNKRKDVLVHVPCKMAGDFLLPSSVTNIQLNAFGSWGIPQCHAFALTNILVERESRHYASEDGVLFDACKNVLIFYPIGKGAESYTPPRSVSIIRKQAFDSCRNLKRLHLLAGLLTIEAGAFYNCEGLMVEWGTTNDVVTLTIDKACWPQLALKSGALGSLIKGEREPQSKGIRGH